MNMNTTREPIFKEPATYEDLFNIPDNYTGEIINGRLSAMPRPALRHATASSSIGYYIGGPFHYNSDDINGWWILDKPELHLTNNKVKDIAVPDLAGWRRQNVKKIPDTANMTIAPDWVCEVLSPSTRKKDRDEKMPMYAKHGVNYVWLIDPMAKTLDAFKLKNGEWVVVALISDDAKVSIEPFDAISFPLNSLWL